VVIAFPPGWVVAGILLLVFGSALGVAFAFLGDVADRARPFTEREARARAGARESVARHWDLADTNSQWLPRQALPLSRPGMTVDR
jgi:hypothetical protein